jgi:hypothetical protein
MTRQPFGRNEKEEALWVSLYEEHPAQHWDELILESEIANKAYGWVTFGLILWIFVIVVFPTVTGTPAQIVSEQSTLISFISILCTYYAALKQERLLPFLRSSRFVHYLATILLAVPGIFGVLIWLIFRQHTMTAKGNISAMRNALALDPELAGISREKLEAKDCLVVNPAEISVDFGKWCSEFTDLLVQKKSRFGIEAFSRSSLINAYESSQTPEAFFSVSFKHRLPEVLHEKILRYKAMTSPGKVADQLDQPPSLFTEQKTEPAFKRDEAVDNGSSVSPTVHVSTEVSPAEDLQPDLQKLFNLYRNGHITEKEFKSLKEKL